MTLREALVTYVDSHSPADIGCDSIDDASAPMGLLIIATGQKWASITFEVSASDLKLSADEFTKRLTYPATAGVLGQFR